VCRRGTGLELGEEAGNDVDVGAGADGQPRETPQEGLVLAAECVSGGRLHVDGGEAVDLEAGAVGSLNCVAVAHPKLVKRAVDEAFLGNVARQVTVFMADPIVSASQEVVDRAHEVDRYLLLHLLFEPAFHLVALGEVGKVVDVDPDVNGRLPFDGSCFKEARFVCAGSET
jgi:hypothetical protein